MLDTPEEPNKKTWSEGSGEIEESDVPSLSLNAAFPTVSNKAPSMARVAPDLSSVTQLMHNLELSSAVPRKGGMKHGRGR